MRSRTSRGVPEWSGGKDLYMGSPVSGIGTSFGVIGIVGQGLRVGDEDKHLTIIAGVLQFDAATERTDKMTDVKTTGGTVAGENNLIGRHVIAD